MFRSTHLEAITNYSPANKYRCMRSQSRWVWWTLIRRDLLWRWQAGCVGDFQNNKLYVMVSVTPWPRFILWTCILLVMRLGDYTLRGDILPWCEHGLNEWSIKPLVSRFSRLPKTINTGICSNWRNMVHTLWALVLPFPCLKLHQCHIIQCPQKVIIV